MKNKSSIIILSLAASLSLFGGFQEYKYDANGRLSGVSGSTDESYAYDSRGNVVQIKKGGEVISFEYDAANQLKQRTDGEGVHTFTYDRAGRLTEEALNGQSVARYTYGYLDKVTAVERKGQTTRFRYNADGMLVEKQYPDGKIEKWSWDGLGLVARGDERYINEPHASGGTPVMSLTAKGVRYHTSDYLGTTLCSTDAQGKVTDRYEATAYGQGGGLQEDPSARFTGKPYDKDLGAFVFPFRNYDSKNVRWFSVDPSGFPDGPNGHFYAPNPNKEADIFGLWRNDGTPYGPFDQRQVFDMGLANGAPPYFAAQNFSLSQRACQYLIDQTTETANPLPLSTDERSLFVNDEAFSTLRNIVAAKAAEGSGFYVDVKFSQDITFLSGDMAYAIHQVKVAVSGRVTPTYDLGTGMYVYNSSLEVSFSDPYDFVIGDSSLVNVFARLYTNHWATAFSIADKWDVPFSGSFEL